MQLASTVSYDVMNSYSVAAKFSKDSPQAPRHPEAQNAARTRRASLFCFASEAGMDELPEFDPSRRGTS